MRKFGVADCETDPFLYGRVPKPFIWGFYDGKNYYYFDRTDDFINFVSNKHIVIYAHNGGKFDWHYVINHLEPFSELMIINGRLAKFKIGKCEFRDSYNILPIPLSAYKKDEFEYWKMESENRGVYKEEIKAYLKNDLKFQYELVESFINNYGMNLTLASTAMNQWRKIEKVKSPKTNARFYNELKQYYYGGRVECFHIGEIKHDFNVIDINSAYPFAMIHNHPYGSNIEISSSLPTHNLEQSFISLTCKSKGAFPFRTKDGLTFPNDNQIRQFHITGWEYKTAKELNLLENCEINYVQTLDETINFKKYVKHFFKMKLNAEKNKDKAKRLFAKLLLNSLYGKFGANPEKYNEYMIIDPDFIESSLIDGFEFCGIMGKYAIVCKPIEEDNMRFYNVAVASSITGFVRALLLKSLYSVKNPLYCDTDSIACENIGKLKLSDNLGDWDLEAVCEYGAIAGKKLYAFKEKNGKYKTACKGVRLNSYDIIKVAKGEEILYKKESPTFSYKKDPFFIERKICLTK